MRKFHGYAAKVPAPKRASSPLCVSPVTFFPESEHPLELWCNGRIHHDGPHYAVGLVGSERYLLAEWNDNGT